MGSSLAATPFRARWSNKELCRRHKVHLVKGRAIQKGGSSGSGVSMPASLVRKLDQFIPLSDAEKQILYNAPVRVRRVEARRDIVSDGDRPAELSLISQGFACRYKLLADGRRQIMSFLIPGDLCDLRTLLT